MAAPSGKLTETLLGAFGIGRHGDELRVSKDKINANANANAAGQEIMFTHVQINTWN